MKIFEELKTKKFVLDVLDGKTVLYLRKGEKIPEYLYKINLKNMNIFIVDVENKKILLKQ